MFFFSLETSKAMQEAGCRSDSGFAWGPYKERPVCLGDATFTVLAEDGHIPAFTLSDFLSPSKQARENCRIWWGAIQPYGEDRDVSIPIVIGRSFFDQRRHDLLDLPEGTDLDRWFMETRGKL